jgi:hypothetical protein
MSDGQFPLTINSTSVNRLILASHYSAGNYHSSCRSFRVYDLSNAFFLDNF